MINSQILNNLKQFLGENRVEENKNLFLCLTLRTKTTAKYFFTAKTKLDLQNAKKASIKFKIPLLIIGGGSNLVILRDCFDGLVVKNEYIKKEIISEKDNLVTLLLSSGLQMSQIVIFTIESGIEGFEYQKGLPGTLGGAIAMNSKWTRPYSYVSDTLQSALILDSQGNFKEVDRSYFQFKYDYSILKKTNEIFIEGVFLCKKINQSILAKRAAETLEYRLKTQPHGAATCGCFFKNISEDIKQQKNLPTTSAGYLIDKLALKNFSVGSYSISDVHANFIINKGQGDSKDLVKLLSTVKEKVKDKFGIELEEEVVII